MTFGTMNRSGSVTLYMFVAHRHLISIPLVLAVTSPKLSPQTCSMSTELESRRRGAVLGMLIGDAMAMPVHWYYNPTHIKRDYGAWLTGFVAPKDQHPSCILNLSATDGSGRSSGGKLGKSVIGDVILHDKLKYWTSRQNTHYHRGMKAGENTLNAVVALEALKVMAAEDRDVTMDPRALRARVFEHYVKFMTTPGSHNDTYAESYHRAFFRDWSQQANPPTRGEDILKLFEARFATVTPANEDHQIPVIGAFTGAIPWIVHYSGETEDACARNTVAAVQLTHPAPSLMPYLEQYARLLHRVLNGADLRAEALKIVQLPEVGGSKNGKLVPRYAEEFKQYEAGSEDQLQFHQEAIAVLGMACYIAGSMPSMLLLAINFNDNFRDGVLMNANCGGENAHRGAALGALLGAYSVTCNQPIPADLQKGLVHQPDFSKL